MQDDITDILALEVKKEMAERYFGFRKLIEEDIKEFDDQVLASFLRLEQQIGFNLVRLYILLKDEKLIHEFFQSAGLEQLIFYDPYLTESPTIRKSVLAGLRLRGFTRAGRFRNLILDIYAELVRDVESYHKNLATLSTERDNIAEEIRQFYYKHDLGTMMDFLRRLDGGDMHSAGGMVGVITPETGTGLEQKMKVEPPPPVDELLPIIPSLTPPAEIKRPLKKIIAAAYRLQNEPDMKDMVRS
ncbi:MAG: hypothetical protein RBR09_05315 [Desulfobulbaceae bacterium]|jgi:hypothetical protein|nr:hypothetical protein [Desulfobulbaceae bacterium]MDY0350656.1 hypothetical protein [Desulfobulbaceae bacterium]